MQHIQSQPSMARFIRQVVFVPYLHNRWLSTAVKDDFAQHITQAELGHAGEIYLIIENHLPIATAYSEGCRERALSLFASHRVWDTEDNTGVLIYVNLCEHNLEIIADRSIDVKATGDTWQTLIEQTLATIKTTGLQTAIDDLIIAVGNVLREHFPSADTHGNELPNRPVYLR